MSADSIPEQTPVQPICENSADAPATYRPAVQGHEARIFREGIAELLRTEALQRAGGAFVIVSTEPSGVGIFIEPIKHKSVTFQAFWLPFRGALCNFA